MAATSNSSSSVSKPKREHVPLYDESQVQIDGLAIVCQDAVFKGKVTVESGELSSFEF